MKTILAAVDDTPAAYPVLETTDAIRHVLHANAAAVHVGDHPPDTVAPLADKLGITLSTVAGEPAAEIIAAAERPDVDLVVLATHGLPAGHEAGHTARLVAGELTKPIIVVPPEHAVRPAPRHVLFPLDGTKGVSRGVRPLIATYIAAGIDVIAVHVFEPSTVPRFLDGAEDAAVWREEFVAKHCAELGIRFLTRPGPTVGSLLEVADTEDVDVIALGWHQHLSPKRSLVVRQVLAATTRPVALIPLVDH